jgi:hypothetical protein
MMRAAESRACRDQTLRRSLIAISVFASFSTLAAAAAVECDALKPLSVRALAPEKYPAAHTLAFLDAGHVAIGSRSGIHSLDLATFKLEPLVSAAQAPGGLPAVQKLRSDGRTIVAFNNSRGDAAYSVADRRLLYSRESFKLLVSDIDVDGSTVVVLGYPLTLKGKGTAALWIGKLGSEWDEYKAVHPLDPAAAAIMRYAFAPHGGAVLIDEGIVYMVNPAEAGVARHRLDGTALATLAPSLTSLTVPNLPDTIMKYGADPEARYREIVNKQSVADDLVRLPDGVAIVVRKWTAGKVGFELWYPNESGIVRRTRLEVEDTRVAGGHLRCDARGPTLACMFGKATDLQHPDVPSVVVFDTSKARKEACR